MIKRARKINPKMVLIVIAERISEALKLYDAGADYVILPKVISGEAIVALVKKSRDDIKAIRSLRKKHIKKLKEFHNILY